MSKLMKINVYRGRKIYRHLTLSGCQHKRNCACSDVETNNHVKYIREYIQAMRCNNGSVQKRRLDEYISLCCEIITVLNSLGVQTIPFKKTSSDKDGVDYILLLLVNEINIIVLNDYFKG